MAGSVAVMDRGGQAVAALARAENMLSSADSIVEIIELKDKAKAIEELIKIANAGWEVEQRATMLRLKCERKAGEWLAVHVDHNGGRPGNGRVTLDDLGVTKSQSHRWQTLASVPVERFEAFIDDHMAKGHDLSAAGLIKYAGNISGRSEVVRSGIWLVPPRGVCRLSGYKVRCAGSLQGHHIINKTMARGNEEVREILAACPPEIMADICEEHNRERWADQAEARKILLLQKIYEYGWSHMQAWVDGLPWKVQTRDLTLEGMVA